MKKIFPWIVLLITISLIGMIFIQVSWIRNAMAIREEQYEQRLAQMLANVSADIVHSSPGLRSGTLFSLQDGSFSSGGFFSRLNIPDVKKVRSIIERGFKEQGLDVPFEFAITHDGNAVLGYNLLTTEYDLISSPQFLVQLRDTMGYQLLPNLLGDDPVSSFLTNRNVVLMITVPKDNRAFIIKSMGWILLVAFLFTFIIITAFALTIYTMLRQKKLSEIKSDFINNMTHEFKTPLATISLAVDAIGNHKVLGNTEKVQYFTGIIKEENKRMNKQVETILQSALLDKQEIRLNKKEIDVHEIIRRNVDNLQLQLQSRNGRVEVHLDAVNSHLWADEVHFSNVISNLLDNALKYSGEEPFIRIHTWNVRKSIVISVFDNGIGMSKETQARIFEKFYRAHTGNLHNVKGFGLGLAYVKAVVDAHGGKVRVSSTLGKGSRFDLEFQQGENKA